MGGGDIPGVAPTRTKPEVVDEEFAVRVDKANRESVTTDLEGLSFAIAPDGVTHAEARQHRLRMWLADFFRPRK